MQIRPFQDPPRGDAPSRIPARELVVVVVVDQRGM